MTEILVTIPDWYSARGLRMDKPDKRLLILYLVIEHSEAMVDQDVSVRLFDSLPEMEWKPRMVDFAWRHLVVIRDFGRYPHRNAALGRVSTAAEQVWLEAGGGF